MSLRIRIERTEAPRSTTRRRRWTVGSATVVASLLVTGVSYAWWSATASGTAAVGSTTAVTLTVSSIASPLVDLYPGKQDALGFTVTNPNPYNVSVTKMTALSVTSSDTTNCPNSNFTINPSYLPIPAGGYNLTAFTVNANNGTATTSLPAFITLNTTAPDGCQGKTFIATLTLTGTQV